MSARLAEIGVRELFLKLLSRSGEFCVQGFLDLLIFVIVLRSEGKMILRRYKIRSYYPIMCHFRSL